MLIEFHIIQNHAPANLNRDDTGSPKECVFGGARRARISSQCLKRSIRKSDIFEQKMEGRLSLRSRNLKAELVKRFTDKKPEEEIPRAVEKFISAVYSKLDKNNERTAVSLFVSWHEVEEAEKCLEDYWDYFLKSSKKGKKKEGEEQTATEEDKSKEEKRSKQVEDCISRMQRAAQAVDLGLFGRMVADNPALNVQASCQVAHALSTHKVDHEFDYFTAVDDLQSHEETGADMIGDVEYNSATYYKYFNLDPEGLTDNLTGKPFGIEVSAEEAAEARELAARAAAALLEAAVRVTPTGKQNSFAAHQLPSAVLVEVRPHKTPVSYANAFVEPAWRSEKESLVDNSLEKLGQHIEALTSGFNLESRRRWLLAPEHPKVTIEGVERVENLKVLLEKIEDEVNNG